MKFATIIPFYQREHGILACAIESVLNQNGAYENTILVVDDGSPVSAKQEIENAVFSNHSDIIVLEKPNGGAASARNFGLDNMPGKTQAIAFIDSDDVWHKDHLHRAATTISMGYDFYFADHQREDWNKSKFLMRDFPLADETLIDQKNDIFKFIGDLTNQCIRNHIIQTSTVVVRKELLDEIRFPETLTLLEDDITWSLLSQKTEKIGFSRQIDVICGSGVNISISDAWGTLSYFYKTKKLLNSWLQSYQFIELSAANEHLRLQRIESLTEDMARQYIFGGIGRKRFSMDIMSGFPYLIKGLLLLVMNKVRKTRNTSPRSH